MRNGFSHFVTIAIAAQRCLILFIFHVVICMHSGACKVSSLELRAGCLPTLMTNATAEQYKPVNGR